VIGSKQAEPTTIEYWMSLQGLLDALGEGQYLVHWPGDFRWSYGDSDIVGDYLGKNSPHLVDYIGCAKDSPYRRYCRGMTDARFIHKKDGVFNFYTVNFFFKSFSDIILPKRSLN